MLEEYAKLSNNVCANTMVLAGCKRGRAMAFEDGRKRKRGWQLDKDVGLLDCCSKRQSVE